VLRKVHVYAGGNELPKEAPSHSFTQDCRRGDSSVVSRISPTFLVLNIVHRALHSSVLSLLHNFRVAQRARRRGTRRLANQDGKWRITIRPHLGGMAGLATTDNITLPQPVDRTPVTTRGHLLRHPCMEIKGKYHMKPPPNSRPPQPPPPPPQVDDEIPPCPMSFPQIQGMSVQELRKILGDRAAFDMYIEEHPHRQYVCRRPEWVVICLLV
jgi:hypothetical protein